MKPVTQEDRTGCAIASVAALTERSYQAIKHEAAQLGIFVEDPRLWSATKSMRRLLRHVGLTSGRAEEDFVAWERLPNRALLAIKWHREKTGPAWHWVVFVREATTAYVLDSKQALRTNRRTDFGRMKPKWFIRIGAK